MKGIICYYSGSGNTKLALEYLIKKITNTDFELHNIVKNEVPDFSKFDVAGFATFADFGGPAQLMYSFFDKVKKQNNKHAFVFNTFGFLSVRTKSELGNLAKSRGFNVLSGFSLHTPENYPPMRSRNMAFDKAPKPKELNNFDNYIKLLDTQLSEIRSGKTPRSKKLNTGIMGVIFPKFPRTQSKKDFGIQNVDESLCIECGKCKEVCPYEAIKLNPNPIFDHNKCHGCWACYNHCPTKAIYTPKFNGIYHYAKPNTEMQRKLG